MVTVPVEPLLDLSTRILQAHGVPEPDARVVSDSLVTADLWNHQSHGLLRLPWYVDRLRTGVMTAVTQAETVVDLGAVAVLDGHDGIGQVLTTQAAREAVRRAKAHGIAAVGVRNSNHFGTAAYYTRMAPAQGCIGFLCTNSSPAMPPWGGRQKTVGSNPWSIAVPAGDGRVAVMDLSNSVVARGKIYLARQEGATIPEGWAITAEGSPTTDPVEALAGSILPMAEHKGYVISVMMDVLAGVLTGSGFGTQVAGPYQSERRSRAGHLFIAIDVGAFLPVEEFDGRMEQLIQELKATPLAPGASEILYSGELEDRAERRGREQGVDMADRTLADLRALAREVSIDADLATPA